MANDLSITLNDDGSISTDATNMLGSEAAILKELQALAEAVGGELEVERHIGGVHSHSHGTTGTHEHN